MSTFALSPTGNQATPDVFGFSSYQESKADTPLPSLIKSVSNTLELEDIQLMDYWSKIDEKLPPPTDFIKDAPDPIAVEFPDLEAAQTVFVDESKEISVTVSRIPERIVHQRQELIENARLAEQQRVLDDIKR